MLPVEIKPGIFWIGVNDRTTDLFEGLWPIEREGVSYNSYLINDEKKVLIDLSKETTGDDLLEHINSITELSNLDYVVINHMEPDHTGAIPALRRMAPGVTFICSKVGAKMLESFYGIVENVQVVKDGDTLPLGKHTLWFISAPNIHWPETMMTYETSEKVLFSCDAFGSYGALGGALYDDECSNLGFYEQEALRYYANILATYSRPVLNAINKVSDIPISMVAPSHGLVWRQDPMRMIHLYSTWAGYAASGGEVGVTLIYGSMYRNTERTMNAVAQGVVSEGLPLQIFDVARTDVSYILPALFTQRGVLVGAPTYEGYLFPPMTHVLEVASLKHIFNKQAASFGSYGWGGGAQKHFERFVETLKWNLFETLEFAGGYNAAGLEKARQFGMRFAKSVRIMG